MKEFALRLHTKVHISFCKNQLYKCVPSLQNWLTLDGESTNTQFLQAVVCVFENKTALQAGHLKSRSAYNHSNRNVLHYERDKAWKTVESKVW